MEYGGEDIPDKLRLRVAEALRTAPPALLREVMHYYEFLQDRFHEEYDDSEMRSDEVMMASEPAFSKIWDEEEQDD